jgi:hypothetical protein
MQNENSKEITFKPNRWEKLQNLIFWQLSAKTGSYTAGGSVKWNTIWHFGNS